MNYMETSDTSPAAQDTANGCCNTEEGGENVLVLTASMDGGADSYCAERLSSPPGTVSPNALLVSLDQSPDRRFDAVIRRGNGNPADVGIVCCDETRSTAATSGASAGPGFGFGPWIATVSSPGDLTGLGVRIEQALSAWADDPEPVELCFHSLTTLLQYVDERAVFRFCHALTRRITTLGANSHFHLDPETVEDRTVNTLSSLFDRVEDRT